MAMATVWRVKSYLNPNQTINRQVREAEQTPT